MTEPMFIFLSLAAVYALVRLARTGAWRWAALGGAAAGLATLTRSVLAGFLPVMALWVWWACGRGRRAWGMAALFTAVVTLAMLPWIVRNAVVLRAFVPTTTDAGHGFYVANNARSLADPRGFHIPADWSFVKTSPEERLDEVEMNRRLMRTARDYLLEHPGEAARLMARRFLTLWRFYPNPEFVSRSHALLYALAYAPLFPFMLMGLWRLHREAGAAWPGVLLMDALILYTTAIHTVFLAMLRYREPLMPLLLPCAALGILTAWTALRARRTEPPAA
jgi:4-amino-4-deoxy-L-arabinose transferase-like glycosyltransferase